MAQEPFFVPPKNVGAGIPPRNMPAGVGGFEGAAEGVEEFIEWQNQQNNQVRNNNMNGGLFGAFFGGNGNKPQNQNGPHGADPNNLIEGNMMNPMAFGWGFDQDGNPLPEDEWNPNDPEARRARAAARDMRRAWQGGLDNRNMYGYGDYQNQFGFNPWNMVGNAFNRHHEAMVETGRGIGEQANINAHRVGQNKDRNLALMLQRERLAAMKDMFGNLQNTMQSGFDSFGDFQNNFNTQIEGEGIAGLNATNPEGPQAIEEEDGVDKFAQAVEPKKVLPEMEWMAGLEGSGEEVMRDMLNRSQTEAGAEIFNPAWDEGADQHIEQQKMAATGVHGQMEATNEERARNAQNSLDQINRNTAEQMAGLDYNINKQGILNAAKMGQARNQMNMMNQMMNQTMPMLMQGMPNV